jgi:hypothetical protein
MTRHTKRTHQSIAKRTPHPGKAAVIGDHPLQLYRPGRLARLLDVHLTTLWRWRKDGLLPPPVQVGPNVRGWTYEQVAHLLHVEVSK